MESIEEPETKVDHHDIVVVGVERKDVETCAKEHITHKYDDHKALNAMQCILNQTDIKRCLVKEAQPVDDLDTHENGRYRCDVPLLLKWYDIEYVEDQEQHVQEKIAQVI